MNYISWFWSMNTHEWSIVKHKLYIWHLISPESYLQLMYYVTQQNGHSINKSLPPTAPMAHKTH